MPAGDSVLVTGVNGFVGANIAVELSKRGYNVVGTVRSERSKKNAEDFVAPLCDGKLKIVTLDFDKPDGWNDALNGVKFVQHVASPFPLAETDTKKVVEPAVNAAKRITQHAQEVGTVERLVLTSSCVAIYPGHDYTNDGPVMGPETWSNLEATGALKPDAYEISKTLAEKAIRENIEAEAKKGSKLTMCSVHPGLVYGKMIVKDEPTSCQVMRMMIDGTYPGQAPPVSFPYSTIRDVVHAHIEAMECAAAIPDGKAAGKRYLVVTGTQFIPEFATELASQKNGEIGKKYPKLPTNNMAYWLVRVMGFFGLVPKWMVYGYNKRRHFDSSETLKDLNFPDGKFQPIAEAAVEMLESMEKHDIIKKPKK